MKLIEIATIIVKRGDKTTSELYFITKHAIKDAISKIVLKDIGDTVRCTVITDDYNKKAVPIRILLTEDLYEEHIGKLVNNAQGRELSRWLNEIACANHERLFWLGSTGIETKCEFNRMGSI